MGLPWNIISYIQSDVPIGNFSQKITQKFHFSLKIGKSGKLCKKYWFGLFEIAFVSIVKHLATRECPNSTSCTRECHNSTSYTWECPDSTSCTRECLSNSAFYTRECISNSILSLIREPYHQILHSNLPIKFLHPRVQYPRVPSSCTTWTWFLLHSLDALDSSMEVSS